MIRWLHDHHLTHPLIALAMMIPFVVAGAPWLGALLAIGFYWGREARDAEIAMEMDFAEGLLSPPTVFWPLRGLWPGNWTRDNHLDFWPVTAVLLIPLLTELI